MKGYSDKGELPRATVEPKWQLLLTPAHVKPMQGGEMEDVSGAIRVLSAHSSAYLLPTNNESTEFLMVDAGMEVDAGNIIATLKQRGLGQEAIKAIAITHGHVDHAAGANRFLQAKIYVGEEEQSFLRGERRGEGMMGKLVGRLAEPVDGEQNIETVKDGDTLTVGSLSVKVHSAPGHTKGSMAYETDGAVFVGDALYFTNKDEAALSPGMMTGDSERAKQTVGELLEKVSDERVWVPSHSGTGSREAVQALATKLKR